MIATRTTEIAGAATALAGIAIGAVIAAMVEARTDDGTVPGREPWIVVSGSSSEASGRDRSMPAPAPAADAPRSVATDLVALVQRATLD
jgi:hypothetical protein